MQLNITIQRSALGRTSKIGGGNNPVEDKTVCVHAQPGGDQVAQPHGKPNKHFFLEHGEYMQFSKALSTMDQQSGSHILRWG